MANKTEAEKTNAAKNETTEDIKQKTIRNIKENYARMEKGIVNQLYYKAPHGTMVGTYREKIWSDMFSDIVPRKFVIEQSVFIIDSNGNVSNEVDLAIFDETYTPYIFKYGHLKFIPIEAVAVVVECKSTSMTTKNLTKWTNSIKELETSKKSFTRTFGSIACGETNPADTQKATRPLRILSCLKTDKLTKGINKLFDIVIEANSENQNITIQWDKEKKNLYDWYESLNYDKCKKKDMHKGEDVIKQHYLDEYLVKHNTTELSLMTFNFQLNQVLMLINNPMFFPHLAYVEMFNNNGLMEGKAHE